MKVVECLGWFYIFHEQTFTYYKHRFVTRGFAEIKLAELPRGRNPIGFVKFDDVRN